MKLESMKYVLWLGSAIVFLTLGIIFFTNSINILVLAAFLFGIILVVGTLTRYAGWGCEGGDERLQKIVAYSMMNSWVSCMSLLWTLMLMYYFKWSYPLSGIQVISLTIIVMLLIFYCWYVYYSFKGDVE